MPHSASTNNCATPAEGEKLLPSLLRLIQNIRREFDVDRDNAKALLTRAASLLCVEIDRHAIEPDADQCSGGLAAWQARRLNLFIESRLDQPIRIKELSAIARLSTAHFSRAFKRTFSETPHAYILRRRIEMAESFMLTSDLSLCEISYRCGFVDQAHLCKMFRRHYGQTPAAWRRERSERQGPGVRFGLRQDQGLSRQSTARECEAAGDRQADYWRA